MIVFPTQRFCFERHDADIERRSISGGVAISGDEDVIQTDGGGRLFCEFENAFLDDPDVALDWRGISAAGDGGATPMIVPFGDIRHQLVGNIFAPDGPGDKESDYPPTSDNVTVSTAAPLRATTIDLKVSYLPGPVRKGMWLSIDHPIMRWRAYRIAAVLADDGRWVTVQVRPPLREAVAMDTPVEWANPRCVMRIDGEMRSPTTLGYAEGSVRFVEHFPGPEGYS